MRRFLPPACRALVLVAVALALALVQNWLMWGFLVSRPSLAGELDNVEAVLGLSMLRFSRGGVAALPIEESYARSAAAQAVKSFCYPESLNECREGRLMIRLEKGRGPIDQIPNVASLLLNEAWQELLAKGWVPRVRDARYCDSGAPTAGLAIHFRKAGRELLRLAYRTSEVANDRYAYSEALYRLTGSEPTLEKQVHFFLEIAGLERLEWPLLWPANFVLVVIGAVVIGAVRRRQRPEAVLN